jgi:hypothetical protein
VHVPHESQLGHTWKPLDARLMPKRGCAIGDLEGPGQLYR